MPNSWLEWLIVVFGFVVCIGMLSLVLLKMRTITVGKVSMGSEGVETTCAPYVVEHATSLTKIEGLVGEVLSQSKSNAERLQHQDNAIASLMLGMTIIMRKIRGDSINGEWEQTERYLEDTLQELRAGRKSA